MRITLAELQLHRVEASETYNPGALDFQGTEFRQIGPLKVQAMAELLAEEIRVRGHIEGRMESNCDRCLVAVEVPLDSNFDLFYRPMQSLATDEDVELPKAELEVGFYSGDGIELADVVTEQVILALPMKVVCGTDCKGLCPVCGANHNLTPCNCAPPKTDSPFDALREG